MTQNAPVAPQSNIESILQDAAKSAGLDSFYDLPLVSDVIIETTQGLATWKAGMPVPGNDKFLVIAMFQGDDHVRIYAWPTVTTDGGKNLYPSRYTLRTQGRIPLVREVMSSPVARAELVTELEAILEDQAEPEPEPETVAAPANGAPVAPVTTPAAPATF
jgi:hypothetical protein